MKASLLYGPMDLRMGEVEDPVPGPGQVLVRVRTTGICGSDVHFYNGDRPVPYPRILGHEFAGDIVALGEGVQGLEPGMRVTAEPNFWCGQCHYCRAGRQNLCLNRVGLAVDVHGTLAEYVVVPARFVWPLPETVSYAQGAMVEPLMVGLHGVFRSGARVGDTVAILGCGTIGLMWLLAARSAGCRVLAIDVIPDKLDLAKRLGAEKTFLGSRDDLLEAVKATTDGLGPDIVVETAGVPVTARASSSSAREATGTNSAWGKPLERSQDFSRRRCWQMCSTRGSGFAGTRAAR